jgi:Domain of unknown function (DUF4424)
MLKAIDRSLLAIVFGFAVFTRTIVRADIAPDPLSGGKNLSAKGREKTTVAMVDEVVKLRLSKDTCQVDVVFTMKNIGKTPETIEVGFPGNYEDELGNFKATVDGTAVKVSQKIEKWLEPYLNFQRERSMLWKTWEMTFPPDKPVKIGVSYFTKMRDNHWQTAYEFPVAEALGAFVPAGERATLEKKLVSRRIEYILRTGSHWSGPIGRCRIEVTFDGLTTDNVDLTKRFFERDRATITRDKIVWDLKDYEPKVDVELSITPETTETATLALLEKTHKQYPEAVRITIILSEFLTAANRRAEADKLLLKLLTNWQDKIAIWGPESENTETLQGSHDVFHLIVKRTDEREHMNSIGFLNPSDFVPVIERIALRVQEQSKLADPIYKDSVNLYAKNIDQMLAWCRKHAKSK